MKKKISSGDKPDTRIIKPDFSLKDKIGFDGICELLEPKRLEKAQKLVDSDKEEFLDEILPELRKAEELADKIPAQANISGDVLEEFSRKILDIKSSSGMYGYPFASEIARSLFKFVSDCENNMDEKRIKVIKVHLKAINVIFNQQIHGTGSSAGEMLMDGLKLFDMDD